MPTKTFDNDEGMKRRSLAGTVGIGFFILGMVFVCVAFGTPNWLVSDPRITGARLDKFGLWTHCFRSLPDQQDVNQRRFFVGCRWIYDPFTTGYDEIRGFLVPGFMVATQLFFTLCFICVIISTVLVLVYYLCSGPDQRWFIQLIQIISWLLLVGGLCGGIAVIVFVTCANRSGWMLGHDNNFFGWSFILAAVGVVALLVASTLFFVDANIHKKKRKLLRNLKADSPWNKRPKRKHQAWKNVFTLLYKIESTSNFTSRISSNLQYFERFM